MIAQYAERSVIEKVTGAYQTYGHDRLFLAGERGQNIQCQSCALVDLTALSRVGFRGADAATYLTSLGFDLPQQPNTLVEQSQGGWVARLSATEYLLLGGLHDFGAAMLKIEQNWQLTTGVANYLLPRQDSHACFMLSGADIPELMAKLCAVDLSSTAFHAGQVVQSSIARINGMIFNVSQDSTPKFILLCDRAAALYIWEVLCDAMQEFSGEVVGIEALL